jgi:ketosteroid isomerase-like protein
MKHFLWTLLIGFLCTASAIAQTSQPTTAELDASVNKLREQLSSAYQRGDIDSLLKFLHPDVVIIFPDAQVLRGPQALKDYYEKMLKSPDHIVAKYSSDPKVIERTIHNDVVLSLGDMNDSYELTDGTKFSLNSKFTITAIRLPNGPPESDGWVVRSFHSSTDAFDNPVLAIAAKKSFTYGATIMGLIGALIGLLIGWMLRRRWSNARLRSAQS